MARKKISQVVAEVENKVETETKQFDEKIVATSNTWGISTTVMYAIVIGLVVALVAFIVR